MSLRLSKRARIACVLGSFAAIAVMTGVVAASAATATDQPAAPAACVASDSYIEVTRGASTERLTSTCGPGRPRFPYAEVLEKPDGTPYFIVDACNVGGLGIDAVGEASKLPGSVGSISGESGGPRVQLHRGDSTRTSSTSDLRVTTFGAVGELVEGDITAAIKPGLNEDPQTISAHFHVCRSADRRGP
jgi:hypothetical protein